jgi:hypothetical protein
MQTLIKFDDNISKVHQVLLNKQMFSRIYKYNWHKLY